MGHLGCNVAGYLLDNGYSNLTFYTKYKRKLDTRLHPHCLPYGDFKNEENNILVLCSKSLRGATKKEISFNSNPATIIIDFMHPPLVSCCPDGTLEGATYFNMYSNKYKAFVQTENKTRAHLLQYQYS
jgi:hypothetical protein